MDAQTWLDQQYEQCEIKEISYWGFFKDINFVTKYGELKNSINLEKYQNLSSLDLSYNAINYESVITFPTSLKKLDLANCGFKEKTLKNFSHLVNLEVLIIGLSGKSRAIKEYNIFKGNLSFLAPLIKLRELDISSTNIANDDNWKSFKKLKNVQKFECNSDLDKRKCLDFQKEKDKHIKYTNNLEFLRAINGECLDNKEEINSFFSSLEKEKEKAWKSTGVNGLIIHANRVATEIGDAEATFLKRHNSRLTEAFEICKIDVAKKIKENEFLIKENSQLKTISNEVNIGEISKRIDLFEEEISTLKEFSEWVGDKFFNTVDNLHETNNCLKNEKMINEEIKDKLLSEKWRRIKVNLFNIIRPFIPKFIEYSFDFSEMYSLTNYLANENKHFLIFEKIANLLSANNDFLAGIFKQITQWLFLLIFAFTIYYLISPKELKKEKK